MREDRETCSPPSSGRSSAPSMRLASVVACGSNGTMRSAVPCRVKTGGVPLVCDISITLARSEPSQAHAVARVDFSSCILLPGRGVRAARGSRGAGLHRARWRRTSDTTTAGPGAIASGGRPATTDIASTAPEQGERVARWSCILGALLLTAEEPTLKNPPARPEVSRNRWACCAVGSGAGRLRLARRGARRASGTRTVARQPHKLSNSRPYAQRRSVQGRTFVGTPTASRLLPLRRLSPQPKNPPQRSQREESPGGIASQGGDHVRRSHVAAVRNATGQAKPWRALSADAPSERREIEETGHVGPGIIGSLFCAGRGCGRRQAFDAASSAS